MNDVSDTNTDTGISRFDYGIEMAEQILALAAIKQRIQEEKLRNINKQYGFDTVEDFIKCVKMANKDNLTYVSKLGDKRSLIEEALRTNQRIIDISDRFDVSVPTVYRIKHEMHKRAS